MNNQGVRPNATSESNCRQPTFGYLVAGLGIGAALSIFLAPKSGEETRRAMRGYARKTEEEVIEKAKEARAALDELSEQGKHFVAEKRADVEAAVTAGKEAMKEKMDKCCS